MDPLTVGVAIALLGMVGTLLSLALLAGLMGLLKRVLPYRPEAEK
jgi:hypothetical protein